MILLFFYFLYFIFYVFLKKCCFSPLPVHYRSFRRWHSVNSGNGEFPPLAAASARSRGLAISRRGRAISRRRRAREIRPQGAPQRQQRGSGAFVEYTTWHVPLQRVARL